MKLKKLLYCGAILGAVGVATIVPITINASMVNDTSKEDGPVEEENIEQKGTANQCYTDNSMEHNSPNSCGYWTTNNHYERIVSTIDVLEAYSNYMVVSVNSAGIFSPAYAQGEGYYSHGSTLHDFVVNPITTPSNDMWYLVGSGQYLNNNSIFHITFSQRSFQASNGTIVDNSPMKNVGLATYYYIAFTDNGVSPLYGTDWTVNSILSGAHGSGKYFFIPGIIQSSTKIIYDEASNLFEFNFDYMPGTFYTGENSMTSPDSPTYTFGQDQIWIALWDSTTASYIYDDMFSWGSPVNYINDPEYGSAKKWANLWVGPGMSATLPGVKYNHSLSLGGTNGMLYDNQIQNGHTYYLDYTSSNPAAPSTTYVQGWNVPGAYWSTVSFFADQVSYPVSTISTTFSLTDSDANGIAEGFNINYSINAGSTSRYVYVKIQDQYQPEVMFGSGKYIANAGTSTGTINVSSVVAGPSNPLGYALYSGHTYSVCMSYKIPVANIDCASTPTGGTAEIYKASYTIPTFKSMPTTRSDRTYIDLTYDIAFDSKQPAYNNFTYSLWDQTNSQWVVSNQVVDYNGKIGTPQTIKIENLNSLTTYDIIINPSAWDGQILNSDGTVTDPYNNNIVIQDVTTLIQMISTSESVLSVGHSNLQFDYYLNEPDKADSMKLSLYDGQGPTTGTPIYEYTDIDVSNIQSGTVNWDIPASIVSRGETYEFYAQVLENDGDVSETYHKTVVMDLGLSYVDESSIVLTGPTSATVNVTWDSEQAGSIYYRTDFNNNGNFDDDQWFNAINISNYSAGVHTLTIEHLVSNVATQQVQLSMYPDGKSPKTGLDDIFTLTINQQTGLGMKEYKVSATKANDVQFQFKYDTQGSNSYEYVSVFADGGGVPTGPAIYTGQMLIEANTNISSFWLSETTPYAGSEAWTDTTLTSKTSYWLVFSFDDPIGSGNKAKVKFVTD